MRRTTTILTAVTLLGLSVMAGCSSGGSGSKNGGKTTVVAAFYPLAQAARQVGGDAVNVIDLTPTGGEPHDLEITPKQVDQIASADVVLVMGHGFQPAVEDVAKRNHGTAVVLDALPVGAKGKTIDTGLDPHVWLDPTFMHDIVDLVARSLAHAHPAGAAAYQRNASTFNGVLTGLDLQYRSGLADCARRTIFTSHAAFGWLAKRYRLQQEAIAGVAPDAEPTADRIAKLADDAKRAGATTIFTEPLVPPVVAQTLAREAGNLRTIALDPLEALTKSEIAAHDNYVAIMRRNLDTLRTALACVRR
ncbi:MAG: ABC-type metal ion transport system, periplasmic component/surface adhesin [Actinomycetia bacterium]|nr:ABC-type metal ion transport system, periplasmic component/surface adhesin [Actinomycetes bacterium]